MTDTDDTLEYINSNQLIDLVGSTNHGEQSGIFDAVDPLMIDPYKPDWEDLVRIHRIIRHRRITTVLEFGCGYSTLVIAHALSRNRKEYGGYVESNLRRGNAFQVHAVDDMPEYVEITRQRIPNDLASFVHFTVAPVNMTTFSGRICTEYETLPNICPDFIYLDGPSQHSALGSINGISTAHSDRLPMACDILKIEHFLLPGTLILIDGRTANARFLKLNLQRNWKYAHDSVGDIHTFELCEPPLGPYNQRQLDFCLGENWSAQFE
ncbi:MAG: hypothetical protein AAB327_00685 [Actinomycetota bacterium]